MQRSEGCIPFPRLCASHPVAFLFLCVHPEPALGPLACSPGRQTASLLPQSCSLEGCLKTTPWGTCSSELFLKRFSQHFFTGVIPPAPLESMNLSHLAENIFTMLNLAVREHNVSFETFIKFLSRVSEQVFRILVFWPGDSSISCSLPQAALHCQCSLHSTGFLLQSRVLTSHTLPS